MARLRLRRAILEALLRELGRLRLTKPLARGFGLRRRDFRRQIDGMIADGAAFGWLVPGKVLGLRKHHLISLSLSDDELVTLVYSLRGTSMRGSTATDMRDATLVLADVLRQASPMTRGFSLPEGMGRASPLTLPRLLPQDGPADAVAKDAITLAIQGWTKLVIHYIDRSEARTLRTVWPLTTTYHGSTLVAWCELRQGFRHFRIDQIGGPEVTSTPIPRPRDALLRDWRAETGHDPDQGSDPEPEPKEA